MVKHTQAIRQLLLTNCLSMFDHFVGLVREGLISSSKNAIKKKKDYDSILPLSTNSNVIDLAWSKLQQALELVFNVYPIKSYHVYFSVERHQLHVYSPDLLTVTNNNIYWSPSIGYNIHTYIGILSLTGIKYYSTNSFFYWLKFPLLPALH